MTPIILHLYISGGVSLLKRMVVLLKSMNKPATLNIRVKSIERDAFATRIVEIGIIHFIRK